MPTMTTTTQSNGRATLAHGGARPAGARRRRQLPLVVVGVLLVVGGALAFADASLHLGSKEQVLAVSRPLAAGQIVQSNDLDSVRVSTGSGLEVIPVSDEANVLGRPASVPLVAVALLTSAEVGATAPVAAGSDLVAVGLKAGQFPPDLGPGDRVLVVPVTSSAGTGDGATGGATSGIPVSATVVAVNVASAESDAPTVFSLQVAQRQADKVAALASANEASLIQIGSGAR
jgi:hypothetical protein